MQKPGPPLETLIRRAIDTPPEFQADPRIGQQGVVHVDALVGDIAGTLGQRVATGELQRFVATDANARNRLALALVAGWVMTDPWFRGAGVTPLDLVSAVDATATSLSPYAPAASFVNDPDRREELVRTLLAALGRCPAGETPTQAQDRLASVSVAQRRLAVEAARDAAGRARKIREALARKAAEESADKMWRE